MKTISQKVDEASNENPKSALTGTTHSRIWLPNRVLEETIPEHYNSFCLSSSKILLCKDSYVGLLVSLVNTDLHQFALASEIFVPIALNVEHFKIERQEWLEMSVGNSNVRSLLCDFRDVPQRNRESSQVMGETQGIQVLQIKPVQVELKLA